MNIPGKNLVLASLTFSLALASPHALALQDTGSEDKESQDNGSPEAEVPTTLTLTIVEEGTLKPIPGATVDRAYERLYPTWDAFESFGSATANEEGVVTIVGNSRTWFIVRAEGFGVQGQLKPTDGMQIELTPEVPITVEVVDFLGQPVPLTYLGVCVGCGHTSDVISATTGPDGRALIRGAAPGEGIVDLYHVHPNLIRDRYQSVPFDSMDKNGLAQIRINPGTLLSGQVLFADGSPAAGIGVGWPRIHRGPWTTTDEQGRFTLFGLPTRPDYLAVKSKGNSPLAFIDGSRAGCSRTITLRGHPFDDPNDPKIWVGNFEKPPESSVSVTARFANGKAAPGVPVEIWDPKTGACFRHLTDELGVATLSAPVGTSYRVEAGGPESPFPTQGLGQVRLDEGIDDISIDVLVPEPRVVSLRLLGIRRQDDVELTRANGSRMRIAKEVVDGLEASDAGHAVTVDGVTLPAGPWAITVNQRRPGRSISYFGVRFPSTTKDLGDTIELDFRASGDRELPGD